MKKICFFTTVEESKIIFENYTLQDIQILRDLGYEVVFANKFSKIPVNCDLYFTWWASGSILPLIKAKLFNIPIICVAGGNEVMYYKDSVTNIPQGYLNYSFFKKLAVKTVLKYSTKIILVSNFMLSDLVKKYALDPLVIYNCVNPDIFKAHNEKDQYALSIFNLDSNTIILKRGKILLKAISNVIKIFPNQKFVIIGKHGNAFKEFTDLILDLKIQNNIKLINQISNHEILKWVQKAQIYIQISDTETFGLSIVEAMSCCTPVMVSSQGAIPEVVGEFGIYVNHNSADSVSNELIKFFLSDNNFKINLGKNLRDRVIKNFSYSIRKEKIKNLINKIIK
jgi:glycosyltransferase involved in cell wall biosynthesis